MTEQSDNQSAGGKQHKRRKRYPGSHPRRFEQRYKELAGDAGMIQLRVTRSRTPGVLLLLLLALGGVAAARFACHEPLGGNDAFVYLEAADNLLKGDGLVAVEKSYMGSPLHLFKDEPLTHFPPLFPLLVAGISACGIAPLDAAVWLNMLLLGASSLMVGYIAYRASDGSLCASIIAGAIFLASPTTFLLHTVAFSEPIFVFLTIAWIALMSAYFEKNSPLLLLSAALLVSLAWMARYVGVALVGTGALALLFRSHASFRRRLIDASTFSAVASLPMIGWLAWNHLTAGTATHRPISYHPLVAQKLRDGLDTVLLWIMPQEAPRIVKTVTLGLVAVTLLAIAITAIRRRHFFGKGTLLRMPRTCRLMCLFSILYLLVIFVSVTFIDGSISFDGRILFPLYVCAVLIACSMATLVYRSVGRIYRALIVCSLSLVLFTDVFATASWVLTCRSQKGTVEASLMYSETMRKVEAIPPDIALYTNAGIYVHFQTGRRAFGLPVKFDPLSCRPNADYEKEMSGLCDGLKKPGSVLVIFRSYAPEYYPSEDEIRRKIDLVTVWEEPQGIILEANRP